MRSVSSVRRICLAIAIGLSVSGCASLGFDPAALFGGSPQAPLGQDARRAGDAAATTNGADSPGTVAEVAGSGDRSETVRARIGRGPLPEAAGHAAPRRAQSPRQQGSTPAASRVANAPDRAHPAPVRTPARTRAAPPIDPDPLAPAAIPVVDADSADLWARIRRGFAMPALDSRLVAQRQRSYLKQPEELGRMFERASLYLYFIVEEIEKRGMPTELALLPFIESAMDPNALSPAKAAGLWQFIPSTGRMFDLSQNWWVDNRRDVVKSTQAALDYLQKIHANQGGDWFLTLAAYNAGEGTVQRAMRRNARRKRPTDYLSLRLPRETRHYVPKLMALKNLVLDADRLGVALPNVPNRPYFVTIEKTRPIDLKLAARLAHMSVEDFVALNPAHNRPVIAASKNNQIVLPADRAQRFLEALERHVDAALTLASWQPYELKPGETLREVAVRSGITLAELRDANDIGRHADPLPGSRILAPQREVADEMQVESFQPRVIERVAVPTGHYRVRRGDTLGAIARRHGTTVANLKRWNGLRSHLIHPGKRLIVGKDRRTTVVTTGSGTTRVLATQRSSLAGPRFHEVRSKETLSGIARRYGVSVSMLKRWNRLRSNLIRPGMRLIVRPAPSKIAESAPALSG
ncbi:MAG: LysM peptidoglycan-binding domain-containing protein [Burkholderiales bacterium]|nr:MAG: LysM peptidoglycan-binding domain-containing protein [Burkholderiales bacterium]